MVRHTVVKELVETGKRMNANDHLLRSRKEGIEILAATKNKIANVEVRKIRNGILNGEFRNSATGVRS